MSASIVAGLVSDLEQRGVIPTSLTPSEKEGVVFSYLEGLVQAEIARWGGNPNQVPAVIHVASRAMADGHILCVRRFSSAIVVDVIKLK